MKLQDNGFLLLLKLHHAVLCSCSIIYTQHQQQMTKSKLVALCYLKNS